MSGVMYGPGPEKRTQAGKAARLGENAMPKLRRQALMDAQLAAYDAVRFRVASALEAARLPQPCELLAEAIDDRLEALCLPWLQRFLGEREIFAWSTRIDQRCDEAGQGIAQL